MSHPYKTLRTLDVSARVEKKNGLSYLSWAFAVDTLLQQDPEARWEFGAPIMFGETMMVSCTVTAFGKPMTSHLPVMDHRNKAVANPDAFAVNTAMQRCLVKAIALHGIGLSIYAGEDLPEVVGGSSPIERISQEQEATLAGMIEASGTNKAALLSSYKVTSLADLQPSAYDHALAILRKRVQK